MILNIYLTFLAISFIFIILGYALRGEADIFKYVGFGFLFLLSLVLIPATPSSLEILNETSTYYKYGDNFSGYHFDYGYEEPNKPIGDIYLFHTYEHYTYLEYKNFTIGFYMALLSIFGIINTLLTTKKQEFGEQ